MRILRAILNCDFVRYSWKLVYLFVVVKRCLFALERDAVKLCGHRAVEAELTHDHVEEEGSVPFVLQWWLCVREVERAKGATCGGLVLKGERGVRLWNVWISSVGQYDAEQESDLDLLQASAGRKVGQF